MRKFIYLTFALCATFSLSAATYTKLEGKPKDGWNGLKVLAVYESSETKAYVWNVSDASKNYVTATITNNKIEGDLADYEITISEEGSNRYYLKTAEGYIGCDAKKNSITFTSGGKECTLTVNGSYTILETNTNTCRFLFNTQASTNRFRFFYDKDKKWNDADFKNICFYVLGDVEQEENKNKLDLQYAHVEMYACESKFPTQSNPYDQYFMTFMFLAQEEDDEAVPQVGLEFLAPTQYSIEGTYRSDYTPGQKYFLNCQAGSKHSYYIFPNNSAQGWGQASLELAEMKITKVGKSTEPNAYVYHIKLVFTDSNKKIWTLDKDMNVYAWWFDCNRQTDPISNMDPVAFALESGNHTTQTEGSATAISSVQSATNCQKIIRDGNLFILRDGKTYTVTGQEVH